MGLFDLLKVFQDILARHKEEVLLEIEREEISMAEMLERLRNMVMSAGELNLRVFFERAKSRRELVLAFLVGAGVGENYRSQTISARNVWRHHRACVRRNRWQLTKRTVNQSRLDEAALNEEASRELAAMVAEAEQSSTPRLRKKAPMMGF